MGVFYLRTASRHLRNAAAAATTAAAAASCNLPRRCFSIHSSSQPPPVEFVASLSTGARLLPPRRFIPASAWLARYLAEDGHMKKSRKKPSTEPLKVKISDSRASCFPGT
ncbi:hypothetical protein E2C01_084082 [Portunus trituberculatus]|uniref:Uncharacterized protein n=1 Tax=Portunus trituberculatus TaxID=210409 RepID=A0A5B7J887_PORTR|nr:hypothetical protein [Portunus trituberculatus]